MCIYIGIMYSGFHGDIIEYTRRIDMCSKSLVVEGAFSFVFFIGRSDSFAGTAQAIQASNSRKFEGVAKESTESHSYTMPDMPFTSQ